MARFIIFLLATMAFSIIAIAMWYVVERIMISLRRRKDILEIEEEAHEKIKQKIKENDYE